ncbi:BppU family phage baseplate upper protein [Lactococcus garvieae]|uniref:BppU family phage baseplate upper protein n=1 Tax=Lactococcus garvieae TaxID=1363 RepID=UPI0032E4B4F1
MSEKTLNLDLAKTPILKSIVYGRIGDEDMQTVTVNVTSRDTPVDLTGFTITFEGITSGGQTKVFDVDGISSTATGLKAGTFDYTFPNMAFAVAGNYEIAYFSIVKGDKRDTTGEFDIIVDGNADIDAPLAETIITEYNKLVRELHAITDKYISDSNAKFADINAKIVDLQAKITQYQTTVKNTADSAISTINTTKDSAINAVNTSSNAAIKAVEDALKQFEAGDFYTKSEMDAKFKAVNDLIVSQDIPEGANLDDYKKEGEFSKKTPTVVTGAPEGVTGAFRLSVRSMVGSSGIFQTLYDYATRAIYYRIGNTTLGFNLTWQRIANNSEVVHLAGDETIAGKKTFSDDTIFKGDVAWTDINLSSQFTGGQPQVMVDRGKWLVVYLNDIKTATTLAANTPVNIIQLPVNMRTDRQQEKTVNIRIASEFVSCRLLLMSTGYIAVVPPKSIPSGSGFGITETFILI